MEIPEGSLNFRKFKDWVLLSVMTLLTGILTHSIQELNDSVRILSDQLAKRGAEIAAATIQIEILKAEQSKHDDRIRFLETHRERHKEH